MLVAVPKSRSDRTADVHRVAAEHAKEASDVTSRILSAVSRGKLTSKVVQEMDLVRECREAREQIVRLTALLEAISGEGED